MAVEVSFHEAASLEFEAAFEWYFARSEFAATKFAEDVNRAITMISDSPKRWPAANQGTRKFLLQRFPFAIFYREIPQGVQLLAIAHGNRKSGYWKGRLERLPFSSEDPDPASRS
jgi:plasmid stabilization system protein ParE